MTSDHYYWDHSVVKVFFISCLIPLVLAIPSSLFTVLTDFNIYQNSTVNIIAIVTLDITTPITWLLYISCIGHIRRSLFDCINCIRCKIGLRRYIDDSKISMEKL
ncbi:hypothetical protein GCK32_019934 [Trichostrongylus colubriformis]|uniref:Uncharacterized protein n=1 Tax=Trichostrongylus colubriformis TaxID=6319 RepID=A0AAN8J1I5_TRICO